jgi:hypothetical protein
MNKTAVTGMSDYPTRTEISLAYAMLAATRQKGDVATGWRMSPKVAVRVADYYGIQVVIPEDLTDFMGLPVQVDVTCDGIALLSERPGIRVAHNDPISDTPERILLDLIAELRDENEWHFTAMANRAEIRLREVTGNE